MENNLNNTIVIPGLTEDIEGVTFIKHATKKADSSVNEISHGIQEMIPGIIREDETYISNNGKPFASVDELLNYSGEIQTGYKAFTLTTNSSGAIFYDKYKADISSETIWSKELRLNNLLYSKEQWNLIADAINEALE